MNIYLKLRMVITRIPDELILKIKLLIDKEIERRSLSESKGKGVIGHGKKKEDN